MPGRLVFGSLGRESPYLQLESPYLQLEKKSERKIS